MKEFIKFYFENFFSEEKSFLKGLESLMRSARKNELVEIGRIMSNNPITDSDYDLWSYWLTLATSSGLEPEDVFPDTIPCLLKGVLFNDRYLSLLKLEYAFHKGVENSLEDWRRNPEKEKESEELKKLKLRWWLYFNQ